MELTVRAAQWDEVERRIRRVPQYADAARIRLTEESLDPARLRPLCRLVRTYRLDGVRRLIAACTAAQVPLFAGIWLKPADGTERLIPPPLIEEHGGQLVIIDGLHRLYEATQTGMGAVTITVLRGELERLPADVMSWDEVSLIDRHTPRTEKFRNLDEAVFRQIHEHIDEGHWPVAGGPTL
jgi:hypothetical protein